MLADIAIMAQWYFLYEALQPQRSEAFDNYADDWLDWRDEQRAASEEGDSEMDAEDDE